MPVTNYYAIDGEILYEETAGVRTWYVTDSLGSVVSTLGGTGQLLNTYRNKPYGSQLAKTGTAPDPAFGFVGSWGYRKTGRTYADFYVRRRCLSPKTGRWTSKDPLWPKEPEYAYVASNPTSYVDISGLQGFGVLPGAIYDPTVCRLMDYLIGRELSPPKIYDNLADLIASTDPTGTLSKFINFGYGNCCGLKLRCNEAGDAQRWRGKLDPVDAACGKHDGCLPGPLEYFSRETEFRCNKQLCTEVGAAGCKGVENVKECENARASILMFYCALAHALRPEPPGNPRPRVRVPDPRPPIPPSGEYGGSVPPGMKGPGGKWG